MKSKGMMIASPVCTRMLFWTQLEAAGGRVRLTRVQLSTHSVFVSTSPERATSFNDVSLCRSNTHVIRRANLFEHLLVRADEIETKEGTDTNLEDHSDVYIGLRVLIKCSCRERKS